MFAKVREYSAGQTNGRTGAASERHRSCGICRKLMLEAAIGFEPMHGGFADLSLNHLGTPPLPLLSSRPNPINYHARESASIEVRPHWRSVGPELPDLRRVPVSNVPSQISCIWPAGRSNSGESLSTLLTSGETGVAINKSLGAGT